MPATVVSQGLEGRASTHEGQLGIWGWLRESLDPARHRPQATPGVEVSHLCGRAGEYYVLKNPLTKTYYRLSDRDYYLWQLMDGTRTVQELVVACFLRYGILAFGRVATLVAGLRANLLLAERPVGIYEQVRDGLQRRTPAHRLAQVRQLFLEQQFALCGLDRWLQRLYRCGGRLLFAWPMQILYVIVTAAGLYCFGRAYGGAQYDVVIVAGSYPLGIATLLAANLMSILVHEVAHGLTMKRYGREVRRGGFMIYFGMPAFFVDTTDIWLEGKGPRLAVTWAGPYSGLILGGLAAITVSLRPASVLSALLFQFAFLSYLTVFLNLNPLLELDGYYLLMDWLEIPMLRDRSLEFARFGLRGKARSLRAAWPGLRAALASFSREERIFAVFGLLTAGWTVYAILAGIDFWQQQLAGAVANLWSHGGDAVRIVVALAGVAVSLPFALSIGAYLAGLARRALAWAAQRSTLGDAWRVAGALLAVLVGLSAAAQYLGYLALVPVVSLLAPALGSCLAWRAAADYAGSRLASAFRLLGMFLAGLLLAEAAAVAAHSGLLAQATVRSFVTALWSLAGACLLLAALLLFMETDLKELGPAEKVLLSLGLAAGYVLLLGETRAGPPVPLAVPGLLDLGASLCLLLALTLLVPTLFSFWQTRFGPAWLTFSLGLAVLLVSRVLGRSPLPSYLLLLSALLLHHLARAQAVAQGADSGGPLDLDDRRRLQDAFEHTTAVIIAQLGDTVGRRQAKALAERLAGHGVAAGWASRLAKGQVPASLPQEMGLIERGRTYAASLTLLLDLAARRMGEKLTTRALQRAYDSLPWEEREVAAQYLFREVNRARALSRELEGAHRSVRFLLRSMPLLVTMDDAEIDLLCTRLRPEHYASGRAIVRQGERGDRFYIIRQGQVEVSERDERGLLRVVNRLGRGDCFGELALLRDAPRSATCRALVPTDVLCLRRQDFDRLVKVRFALREKVGRSVVRADLLRRIPLFAELDARQIQRLAACLQEEQHPCGEVIVREGEVGETFYVIESGQVQVSVSRDGQENVIAQRGAGEYVGEIALLLAIPRTATVRALVPTRVLALHRADFDRLVRPHLYVSRTLEREASRRMIDLRRLTSGVWSPSLARTRYVQEEGR